MASLTDRAFVLADDIGSKVSVEALDELKGESERSWALIVFAFVIGAGVALAVIVLGLRRGAETVRRSEEDPRAEPATSAESDSRTRPWEQGAQHARAGLSAAFRFGSRGSR